MTPGAIILARSACSGRRLSACVLLLASGVVIWRPYFAPSFSIPLIRIALLVHSLAAVGLIIVIMVHIYAALWVKRHHYRDGGRLGAGGLGQETSSALVP